MFTGLVEGCGLVESISPEGPGVRLHIRIPAEIQAEDRQHERTELGESIAINGCCLTVVEFGDDHWQFQAGSETLSRTNLGELKPGDRVNIERSLKANARLGGHFVQGHIDGQGTVKSITPESDWTFIRIAASPELTFQMVPKGSITVDGVSLTVVDVDNESFSIALIPHTLQVTTIGDRGVGDAVNLETDILGKYIQKMMAARADDGSTASDSKQST